MITYTGIGRYIQNLLINLPDVDASTSYEALLGERRIHLDDRGNFKSRKARYNIPIYSLREQVLLPSEMMTSNPDVLHYPSFNMPIFNSKPVVVTIHDLIYFLYPGACPNRLAYMYARFMFRKVVSAAAGIITVSQYSKDDIVAHLGVAPEKITVVYNGVSDVYKPITDSSVLAVVARKYGITGEYIFYVGSHHPRKNLKRLIHAYARLRNRGKCQLILTGEVEERRRDLYKTVDELGLNGHVLFIGRVGEDDLPTLYSMAKVFVLPSFYEGFGLPLVEAFACGTPVVTSNVTSLPEVAGDAALIIDPADTDALTKALDSVLVSTDLCFEMREKGFKRAAMFNWREAARKTHGIYKAVSEVF